MCKFPISVRKWTYGNGALSGPKKCGRSINRTIFNRFASNLGCAHDFVVFPPGKQERQIWGQFFFPRFFFPFFFTNFFFFFQIFLFLIFYFYYYTETLTLGMECLQQVVDVQFTGDMYKEYLIGDINIVPICCNLQFVTNLYLAVFVVKYSLIFTPSFLPSLAFFPAYRLTINKRRGQF